MFFIIMPIFVKFMMLCIAEFSKLVFQNTKTPQQKTEPCPNNKKYTA